MNIELDRYFSDKLLVKKLCNRRLKIAQRNRREGFFSSVMGLPHAPVETELQLLLPPRRLWSRFRPKQTDRKLPPDQLARLLAHHMARFAIQEASRAAPRWSWADNLRKFLCDTRDAAINWTPGTSHQPSKIALKSKGDNKYRIIAEYSLRNTLICAGFSAYLRDVIDDQLLPAVKAFRTPPNGPVELAPHSDAFRDLLSYRSRIMPWRKVWVAECDIQGFFDSVSHCTAQAEASRMLPATADVRLKWFLTDFLAGYNYAGARAQALEAKPEADIKDIEGILRERFPERPESNFGIPQGSFMSCVLANIVLDSADKACMAELEKTTEALYIRYCDDILIAHTNRSRCTRALSSYIEKLGDLWLPSHPAVEVDTYSRDHWEQKSKSPYQWSCAQSKGHVPWVGFVGYQLKRDGKIRVRRSTIDKQRAKHVQVYVTLKRYLTRKIATGKKMRQTKEQVKKRVLMHLSAISVGYPGRRGELKPRPGSICWSAGFDLMKIETAAGKQLDLIRGMDRHRADTYRRCAKLVDSLPESLFESVQERERRRREVPQQGDGEMKVSQDQAKRKRRRRPKLKYLGKPFSYYYQFANKT